MSAAARERRACLGAYWGANLLLVGGMHLTRVALPGGDSTFTRILVAGGSGWLMLLPIVAAGWLAIARQAWWRRPLVTLGLMLSLDVLWWLMRQEHGASAGALSLLLCLPTLAAALVWCVVALLGRWRTILAGEDQGSTPQTQFALWEMFVWTLMVAAWIWPMRRMIQTALNELNFYPNMDDYIVRYIAFNISITFVPALTLVVASLMRMALSQSRPSLAICFTFLLGLIAFVALCRYAFSTSSITIQYPIVVVMGMVGHGLFLGYFLRRLGYRIESRSWWARR